MDSRTWKVQLLALLKRNFLIIIRNKTLIIFEVFSPLMLIGLLSLSVNSSSIEKLSRSELSSYSSYELEFEDVHSHTFYISPNNSEIEEMMNAIFGKRNVTLKYFEDEKESSSEYLRVSQPGTVGIHFFNRTAYALRFSHKTLPAKENMFVDLSKRCVINHSLEHCSSTLYRQTGFAWLQMQINLAILQRWHPTMNKTTSFEVLDSNVKVNSFYYVLCSFCFTILFVGLLNTIVVSLVGERETKVVEYMKIMGMFDSAYSVSWAFIYFALVILLSILACLFSWSNFALKQSNFFLLFIFFNLYGLTFVTLGLVLVPIFKNSNLAGHVVSSLVILYSLIFIFLSQFEFEEDNHMQDLHSVVPFYVMILFSCVSPIAFSLGMNQIMYLESIEEGLNMQTLFVGKYTVFLSFVMLLFDIMLYTTLSFLVNKIRTCKLNNKYRRSLLLAERRKASIQNEQEMIVGSNFDSSTSNRAPATSESAVTSSIVIENLEKVFREGKSNQVNAIKNFNLNICENEITAIIGHNGAGKTTLFNILSGIYSCSSGSVQIYDMDISNIYYMPKVRSMIGLCSQFDTLHPDLTSYEQFQFFTKMKQSTSDIENWINELIPEDVKNTRVSHLSVGQKQKLKLAIALIGNPKILLLDEPTTGMDILARNHVWKILKNLKSGKVILLSTHLMNEADILADKKAILCNGSVKCFGSSLFLKTHFGIGYHLSLVVSDSSMFDDAIDLIKSHIPNSSVERTSGNDIVFNLPLSTRNQFSNLFEEIENHMNRPSDSLKILNFGVTLTTLEEVFVRIQTGYESEVADDDIVNDTTAEDFCYRFNARRSASFHTQLLALVKRKLKEEFRNKNLFFAKVAFPILFLLCFVTSSKLVNLKFSQDSYHVPFQLDYSLYDSVKDSVVVYCNMTNSKAFITNFKQFDTFVVDSSIGATYAPHIGLYINQKRMIGLYQESFLHALPILINFISNAILSTSPLENSTNNKIVSYNWVWPATSKDSFVLDIQQINQMLYFMSFALLTVSSMFSTSPIIDRTKKCYRQLKLADLKCTAYWSSHLLCDLLQLMILLLLSTMIFFAGHKNLIGASFYFIVFFVLSQYMPAILLFSYFITLPFKKTSFVQFSTPIIFYFLGFAVHLFIIYYEIYIHPISFSFKYFLSVINPPYGLALAFDSFHLLFEVLHYDSSSYDLNYYFNNNYFNCFISPILTILLYFTILVTFDKFRDFFSFQNLIGSCYKRLTLNDNTGENVCFMNDVGELSTSRLFVQNPVISVKRLTRIFGSSLGILLCRGKKKVAIRNVSFDVSKGETLGLLGPNGAGKSTLINMMVNDIIPTSGKVEICGKSPTACGQNVFSKLGFCPQENSCWDSNTVLEHLNLYLEVRGITNERDHLVRFLVKRLKLENHLDKVFKDLSGGCKRKLCFVISQIGQNESVLLDEPTAGLDPVSRKLLWKCFRSLSATNPRGVLLSTHSMEEAEALCSKLAIIVNGQIYCSGLTHQLKNHSDSGYTLEVKLVSASLLLNSDCMSDLKEFVSNTLIPGCETISECYDWVSFRITQNKMPKLSTVFHLLETNKERLHVDDYSFSRATLEQVFLELFKFQMEDGSDGDTNLLDVLHSNMKLL